MELLEGFVHLVHHVVQVLSVQLVDLRLHCGVYANPRGLVAVTQRVCFGLDLGVDADARGFVLLRGVRQSFCFRHDFGVQGGRCDSCFMVCVSQNSFIVIEKNVLVV